MRKHMLIGFVISLVLFHGVFVNAAEDTPEFIKNNPDGQKYDFVRNYLIALNYINLNETRKSKHNFLKYEGTKEEKIDQYVRELTRDNVNIRTARNLMKRYFSVNNPLMVKVTDIFYVVCDEQTKLNDEEINLMKNGVPEKAVYTPNNLPDKNKNPQGLLNKQIELSNRRKDSLQKLLEASVLVSKVLVSSQADGEGDLVVLGVNDEQRKKLLLKMDEFYGAEFEGKMREGQSYLEASVVAIREILEDYSWGTLDDLAKGKE